MLDAQRGFQYDFIGVGERRRNVTTQITGGKKRRLTVWPDASEIVDGKVTIYADARVRRTALAKNNQSTREQTIQDIVDVKSDEFVDEREDGKEEFVKKNKDENPDSVLKPTVLISKDQSLTLDPNSAVEIRQPIPTRPSRL